MKRNIDRTGLVEHHTHYKEIDGFDRTIWMTRRDHAVLHLEIRRMGRGHNVSPKEMIKIVTAANHRTEKSIKKSKEWKNKNKDRCIVSAGKKKKNNPEKLG